MQSKKPQHHKPYNSFTFDSLFYFILMYLILLYSYMKSLSTAIYVMLDFKYFDFLMAFQYLQFKSVSLIFGIFWPLHNR